MFKVELLQGLDRSDLQDQINRFLSGIDDESVRDIEVDMEKYNAVVKYIMIEAWKNRICADCKYWDDGGESSAVGGLCHELGNRRRFNCKACQSFKDIRR